MRKPEQNKPVAAVVDFERAVEAGLLTAGVTQCGLLLAVSGGADSTALMCAAARLSGLGLRLEVVSFDHGFRPESQREAAQVVAEARALGLAAHLQNLGLDGSQPAIEERAREARYQALEKLRVARGLVFAATAHTANDQAETVLMRLGRGASMRGAAAILPRFGALVRPMLSVTREQVRTYLAALNQTFVDDPMNLDPRFLRVRVRHRLLPAYDAACGPKVVEHLAQFARLAGEDEGLLRRLADAQWERVVTGQTFNCAALESLEWPLRRRLLTRFLEEQGLPVDGALLERVFEAVAKRATANLPHDWLLRCSNGVAQVEKAPPRQSSRKFTPGDGHTPN